MKCFGKLLIGPICLALALVFSEPFAQEFSIEDATDGNRIEQVWQPDYEIPTALLDGISILYSLFNGDVYEVTFSGARVTWRGISGSVKGTENDGDIRYQSHMFQEGVYLVQWDVIRDDGDYDYVNLHIDLNTGNVAEAGLYNYGANSQGTEMTRFLRGKIYSVREM